MLRKCFMRPNVNGDNVNILVTTLHYTQSVFKKAGAFSLIYLGMCGYGK
ncbi:hypothetical protein KN1_09930 [Stygiolobus caldivivus]|uniref:Uncharacterized protein n=1 Tax=Stygiolobus caldivivus TaxID=2824673 RepID=A0A8D5U6F5_9CREN|nr:hypothetical protein KN1_09930 [Stygiolobus caldivivus]